MKIFNMIKNYKLKHEMHKDAIYFFNEWLKSKKDLSVFLNNNLQAFEVKIGRYRFDKLSSLLKELKICNSKRASNGNLMVTYFSANMAYDKMYIENIIKDITRGRYDKYLN